MALGPTVILRALTCLDKGPETGGFSRGLGLASFISIFMDYGDGDQLMSVPIAAVVIFFLVMCMKCPLSSLTRFLWHDTNTYTQMHLLKAHNNFVIQ